MKNLNILKHLFLLGIISGFGVGSFCGIVLRNDLLAGVGFFVFLLSFIGMCIGDAYFSQKGE